MQILHKLNNCDKIIQLLWPQQLPRAYVVSLPRGFTPGYLSLSFLLGEYYRSGGKMLLLINLFVAVIFSYFFQGGLSTFTEVLNSLKILRVYFFCIVCDLFSQIAAWLIFWITFPFLQWQSCLLVTSTLPTTPWKYTSQTSAPILLWL